MVAAVLECIFTFSFLTMPFFNVQEQKFLVSVILMVPCYAVESVRCYVSALFKRSIPIFAATILDEIDLAIQSFCITVLTHIEYSCSTSHWSIHQ
jgi:hypothetical protein